MSRARNFTVSDISKDIDWGDFATASKGSWMPNIDSESIAETMRSLREGFVCTKINNFSRKLRKVRTTEDLSKMLWMSAKTEEDLKGAANIDDLRDITLKMASKRIKLVFVTRSLDLQCKSQREAAVWYTRFRWLLKKVESQSTVTQFKSNTSLENGHLESASNRQRIRRGSKDLDAGKLELRSAAISACKAFSDEKKQELFCTLIEGEPFCRYKENQKTPKTRFVWAPLNLSCILYAADETGGTANKIRGEIPVSTLFDVVPGCNPDAFSKEGKHAATADTSFTIRGTGSSLFLSGKDRDMRDKWVDAIKLLIFLAFSISGERERMYYWYCNQSKHSIRSNLSAINAPLRSVSSMPQMLIKKTGHRSKNSSSFDGNLDFGRRVKSRSNSLAQSVMNDSDIDDNQRHMAKFEEFLCSSDGDGDGDGDSAASCSKFREFLSSKAPEHLLHFDVVKSMVSAVGRGKSSTDVANILEAFPEANAGLQAGMLALLPKFIEFSPHLGNEAVER
eukprot:g1641.t1